MVQIIIQARVFLYKINYVLGSFLSWNILCFNVYHFAIGPYFPTAVPLCVEVGVLFFRVSI